MPYARTGAETMSLREKKDGLYFEATLDRRDAQAESLSIKIQRGDLKGVSVGFRAEVDTWTRGDPPHRRVEEAELFEISLTPFPAYTDTDVKAVRDAGLAEAGAEEKVAEEENEDERGGGDKDKDKDKDKKRSSDQDSPLQQHMPPVYYL